MHPIIVAFGVALVCVIAFALIRHGAGSVPIGFYEPLP